MPEQTQSPKRNLRHVQPCSRQPPTRSVHALARGMRDDAFHRPGPGLDGLIGCSCRGLPLTADAAGAQPSPAATGTSQLSERRTCGLRTPRQSRRAPHPPRRRTAHRPSALLPTPVRAGRSSGGARAPAAGPPGTIRATLSLPAARLPAIIVLLFLAWDLYYPADKVLLIFFVHVGMGFGRLAETERLFGTEEEESKTEENCFRVGLTISSCGMRHHSFHQSQHVPAPSRPWTSSSASTSVAVTITQSAEPFFVFFPAI